MCVFKTEASDQNVKFLSLSSESVTEVARFHGALLGYARIENIGASGVVGEGAEIRGSKKVEYPK